MWRKYKNNGCSIFGKQMKQSSTSNIAWIEEEYRKELQGGATKAGRKTVAGVYR